MVAVAAFPRSYEVMWNTRLHPRLATLSGFDPLTHLHMIVLAAVDLSVPCPLWARGFEHLVLS